MGPNGFGLLGITHPLQDALAVLRQQVGQGGAEAAAAEYRSGLGYGPEKPEEAPLVYALVTKDGVARY